MKDTERRIKVLDFIEADDSTVIVKVKLVYCLNNIAQRLYELIECYRFYYFGLNTSPESIRKHKRTIELRFPYTVEESFDDLHKKASLLVNANFIVNLIQIVNDELIEILIAILAWRLAKAGIKYADLKLQIERSRAQLELKPLPALLDRLKKEVGSLDLREQLESVNKVRRAYVHSKGCVKNEVLDLKLYVPTILADFSMATLKNHLTAPPVTPNINSRGRTSVSSIS